MIFHEIYGSYYNAVAAILKEASEKQLTSAQLRNIVEKYAFGESSLSILPALQNENWSLMKDGKSILKCAPSMPLTTLQKKMAQIHLYRSESSSFWNFRKGS